MNLRFAWAVVLSLAESSSAAQHGTTTIVSVNSSGALGNGTSSAYAISADARWISYFSTSTNLVAGDTNHESDVFLHDRQTGATSRVSVDSNGTQANGASLGTGLSADGRFVAFSSSASNLVSGDTNGVDDLFVHDRVAATTERVSVSSNGTQADGPCNFAWAPSLSDDGRFVAFFSSASTLVAGDTNGKFDIFVRDRLLGLTTRASVDSAGGQGNGDSFSTSLTANGRFVAFMTDSVLVAGDTNGFTDAYVHDRLTGATTRISVSSSGAEGDSYSGGPAISGNGRWVVFESNASTLVANDTNNQSDIFLHDRGGGTTERVNVSNLGEQAHGLASRIPRISADGRFVAFDSFAFNLVPGDTNGRQDVFVYDRARRWLSRASVSSSGVQSNGHCNRPSLSADGRSIVFGSSATNLVPGDTNAIHDAYVLQVDCWPSASYCEAGISSSYCRPGMSSTGLASASSTSGFTLTCDGLDGQRNGLIFYGTSGQQAQPWGPVGGSVLCVKPPVQRTTVHFSGGTALYCDGSISIDWLAYLAAHPGALGLPLTPGALVDAQCWYRDPGAPVGSNLSNALEFEICP